MSIDNTQTSIIDLAQQILGSIDTNENVPESVSDLYDPLEWVIIRKCLLGSSEISRLEFLVQNITFRTKYSKDEISITRQKVIDDFNLKLGEIRSQREDTIQKQKNEIALLKETYQKYLDEISEDNLKLLLEQEVLLQKDQELKAEKDKYKLEYQENQNEIAKLQYHISGFNQL